MFSVSPGNLSREKGTGTVDCGAILWLKKYIAPVNKNNIQSIAIEQCYETQCQRRISFRVQLR